MSVYDKPSREWCEADEARTTEILKFINRITEGVPLVIDRVRGRPHSRGDRPPDRYEALIPLCRGVVTSVWGATEAACADEVLRWYHASIEEALREVSGVRGFLTVWAKEALLYGLRRAIPPSPMPDPRDSGRLVPGEHLPRRLAGWTYAAVDPRGRRAYLTDLLAKVRAFAELVGTRLPGVDSSSPPDPLDPLP